MVYAIVHASTGQIVYVADTQVQAEVRLNRIAEHFPASRYYITAVSESQVSGL